LETLPPQVLDSGERLNCRVNYHDYGVVGIEFELAFDSGFITIFLEAHGGLRTDLIEGQDAEVPGNAAAAGHQLPCDVCFDDVALFAVQPFCPDRPPPPHLRKRPA